MKLIEVLKTFGLSDYEAKALVALISKGTLTAKEIAEISGIPRTSVYDVMNSLMAKGLVEVFGKPLKFKALSAEEVISILSKRVHENLEYLRRELPKLETKEIYEIRVYRGEIVLSKLKELISNAEREVLAILSYTPDDIKEILKDTKCKLILVSSNARDVKNSESYEFRRREELIERFKDFCHGLFVVDDRQVMVLFFNEIKMGILSNNEGIVQFSKMLIYSVIEYLKH